ncbi:MAG: radical SAM/SPASM domain-containing protein [Thermodesulfovibrionales bacterium]
MRKHRYYIENEECGFFRKVKNAVYGRKIRIFPESIVLETIAGCNARCVFCAQHELRQGMPNESMQDALFMKIVQECSKYEGLLKRFSFAFDNEPLLDKNLLEKVLYVKNRCPFVTTNITTNGILLTRDIIEKLYEQEAVDEINISVQSIRRETYEKLTGVKTFEKVMANMEELEAIHKGFAGKKPVIEINTCITPETIGEEKYARKYWQGKGFRSNYIALDNRSQKNPEYSRLVDNAVRYYEYCRRPFHTMVICWDGVVPICCADYQRSCMLGDVSVSSLFDVWNGESMNSARKELLTGQFNRAGLCASCKMAT